MPAPIASFQANGAKNAAAISEKILDEARSLVAGGARELVLLGQIVDRFGLELEGSYHLPQLLADLSEDPWFAAIALFDLPSQLDER